jgi:hypothetical protein
MAGGTFVNIQTVLHAVSSIRSQWLEYAGSNLKCMLLSNEYEPNYETDQYISSIEQYEIFDEDYSRLPLTNVNFNETSSPLGFNITADDIVFEYNVSGVYYAVIFDDDTGEILCICQFVDDQGEPVEARTSGQGLIIKFSNNVILSVTLNRTCIINTDGG